MEQILDILEFIKGRRSIRKYKEKEIPEEIITRILEAGRWAPSASNNQPWRFIVITDKGLKKEVRKFCAVLFALNRFVDKASHIIVILSNYHHRWVEVDCGMCAQNMMLEAYSLGIGSCFIGAFSEKKIKSLLGVPEKAKIIGLITLGYPDEKVLPKERHNLEKIVYFNKFKDTDAAFEKIKMKGLSFASKIFKK